MKKYLLLSMCVLFSGCIGGLPKRLPETIKQLATDPATVKFDIVSPGITVHFERAFPTNWVPPARP